MSVSVCVYAYVIFIVLNPFLVVGPVEILHETMFFSTVVDILKLINDLHID